MLGQHLANSFALLIIGDSAPELHSQRHSNQDNPLTFKQGFRRESDLESASHCLELEARGLELQLLVAAHAATAIGRSTWRSGGIAAIVPTDRRGGLVATTTMPLNCKLVLENLQVVILTVALGWLCLCALVAILVFIATTGDDSQQLAVVVAGDAAQLSVCCRTDAVGLCAVDDVVLDGRRLCVCPDHRCRQCRIDEVARLKPTVENLTQYYTMLAAGDAIGDKTWLGRTYDWKATRGLRFAAILLPLISIGVATQQTLSGLIESDRNFFEVLRVEDKALVHRLSADAGLVSRLVHSQGDTDARTLPALWVIVADKSNTIWTSPRLQSATDPEQTALRRAPLCTDQNHNLLSVFRAP